MQFPSDFCISLQKNTIQVTRPNIAAATVYSSAGMFLNGPKHQK
jgi:hypothetical protein